MQQNLAIFSKTLGVFIGLSYFASPFLYAEGLYLTPNNPPVLSPFPQESAYATPALNSRSIALEALKQGQTRQGVVLLDSWLDDHPEDLDAFFQLAKANYHLGDFSTMRRNLATLKTLAPQDVVTQNAWAWASGIPEAKTPTVDDEKNKVLLNLARSVAQEKESSSPFTMKDASVKGDVRNESPFPSKALEPQDISVEKTSPLPLVKEALVDEKINSPVAPNTVASQKDVKAPPPTASTVGAAASVQAPSTTPLTQEQIAQNFQMLQQLMMMQMVNNSQNGMNTNNPMTMMMMNGQGNSGMNNLNGLNMMNNQGVNPAMNPQMMNQMMQNALLNNMNGMFNTNNDNQNNNNNGFGF